MGDLIKIRRGTKEVESFTKRQETIRHELKENVNREEAEEMIWRDMVVKAMENKLTDNISKGARNGRELHQLKGRRLWRLGRDEERRKFMNTLRDRLGRKRTEVRREHKNQLRAIRIDGKKEDKLNLPKELRRYKKAEISQRLFWG